VIPTNKPISRIDYDDLVYKSEKAKFNAIADEITERNKAGQPVLVGTTSVEKSEALSRVLERRNIPVNVLNAKQHEREAYVVAQAGRKGAVTVATNMAGRGTDILLGGNAEMIARTEVMDEVGPEVFHALTDPNTASEGELPMTPEALEEKIQAATKKYVDICKREKEEVLGAGGLFILGTERHDSRRVDNQLRGRSGRQGDVGASRFYLSLEDDLMRIFAGERVQTMMDRLGMEEDIPIEHKWVTRAVENAQKKVEERNFDIRKNLLDYDDVMNQQRKSIYALRRQVLTGEYRSVPNEEQKKKGQKPTLIVSEADPELTARAVPILEQMLRHHASPLVPRDATEEEKTRIEAERATYRERAIGSLGSFRPEACERDVYLWFGCQVSLSKLQGDPARAFEFLKAAVGLSLTEQRERLYDLVDEFVGNLVEQHCPSGKHHEDWDTDGLKRAYEEAFGMAASGFESVGDQRDVAQKLYQDAEAVLGKKFEEFGSEGYLRLFRNVFMQEIDREWIEHLQAMDNLRDGIGLRGYGQRDPKREYKREGFDMFQKMMEAVKMTVLQVMFRAQRVTEEDLAKQEEARRRVAEERARGMRGLHADAQAGGGARSSGAPAGGPDGDSPILNRRQRRQVASRRGPEMAPQVAPAQTVKREKPKVGRNDPCWCGSGKKYKNCHFREDRAAQGASDSPE
ncbi:MAG: SEC-C domain-containing protein, partial [Myxococcales bacterium]|nr:SEC-C domain-containing protein [Myxococcales bacterium]